MVAGIVRAIILFLIVLVLAWEVFWAVCGGFLSRRRGRDASFGALWGLLLGPIGLIIVWALTRPQRERDRPRWRRAPSASSGEDEDVERLLGGGT